MAEITCRLMESGQQFLWVIRLGLVTGNWVLPEGFTEDTNERRMPVGYWQEVALAIYLRRNQNRKEICVIILKCAMTKLSLFQFEPLKLKKKSMTHIQASTQTHPIK